MLENRGFQPCPECGGTGCDECDNTGFDVQVKDGGVSRDNKP